MRHENRRSKRYAPAEAGTDGFGRGAEEVTTRASLVRCDRVHTGGVQTTRLRTPGVHLSRSTHETTYQARTYCPQGVSVPSGV